MIMNYSLRLLMVTFLFAASVMFSVVSAIPLSSAQTSSNLVVGVSTNPPTSWVQTATSWGGDNTITQVPYLYCYTYGISGTAVPDLCDIPTPVAGSNDTQWIINLRSANMKWSDGVTINSTDLAYSYGIYLTTGPFANLSTVDVWGNIQGTVSNITIVNSTAIMLQTAAPDPLFLYLTWLYQIYPWHYYKQFTGNNILGTTSILGGPGDTAYIPSNYTGTGNSMTLVPNPSSPSWNGASPTVSTITLEFFTEDQPLVNALAAGSVDAAVITASDQGALNTTSFLTIDQIPSINQMYAYIEPTGTPFNNTDFRQALMTLIPKYQIDSQLYNNQTNVGNSLALLPQAVSEYWPASNAPEFNYSTSQAITLLKAAGLTQNSAGQWQLPNGTVMTVNVEAPNNDPNFVRADQMIVSAMQGIGLQANSKIVDYTTDTNDIFSTGDYQMILSNQAYFPSPYKWMRNPVNLPLQWVNTSTYATWHTIFQTALHDVNTTSSLQELKQSELILANFSIIGSIVVLPQFVAYNSQSFSDYQPALSNALNYQTFYFPTLAENFFTAVVPSASGTSTTTSSSGVASTTSSAASVTTSSASIASTSQSTSQVTSSSSSTTQGTSYALVAGIVVVIIIIVAAAVLLMRRKPSTAAGTTSTASK
jgi:hypothetical protein